MQEQTNHLDDSTEGEIKLPDLPNVLTERVVKVPSIFTGAAYSLDLHRMDKQEGLITSIHNLKILMIYCVYLSTKDDPSSYPSFRRKTLYKQKVRLVRSF
jgi:hypothetical protein